MDAADRGMFIAGYSRLVAEVWADPARERLLETDPRALAAECGLAIPDSVRIRVIRDVADAEPNLDEQVRLWQTAAQTGELTLVVPALDLSGETELADDELDAVVAGLDSSCACCCPCCCTS
jgi:hypothetical protein